MSDQLLNIALERVAEYRKTRHLIGMPYQAFMIALADEIERLQRENDTCGLQCSATMKSLLAEVEQLRTTLTGISTCSTCEACRGAAQRALGVICDHDPMSQGSTLECDTRGALICKHCDEFDRSHAWPAQPPGDEG